MIIIILSPVNNFITCGQNLISDLTEYPYTKKHDICAIYEEVKNRHTKSLPLLKVSVQHPNLKPRLRDYQKKAVIWMLTRECFQSSELSHTSVEGII